MWVVQPRRSASRRRWHLATDGRSSGNITSRLQLALVVYRGRFQRSTIDVSRRRIACSLRAGSIDAHIEDIAFQLSWFMDDVQTVSIDQHAVENFCRPSFLWLSSPGLVIHDKHWSFEQQLCHVSSMSRTILTADSYRANRTGEAFTGRLYLARIVSS